MSSPEDKLKALGVIEQLRGPVPSHEASTADAAQREKEHTSPATETGLISEDHAATVFVDAYRDRIRYDPDRKTWLTWNGSYWEQDSTGRVFSWIREAVRDYGSARAKSLSEVAKVGSVNFAKGVETFARTTQSIVCPSDRWDANPDRLGTPCGTVDLKTGRLLPADLADLISMTTTVAPAPAHTDCPRWLAFLTVATGGDPELMDFLQRWAGYCLTGHTREHTLVFLYGGGGNGKSVLVNTLARIMGDYARTAQMDTFTASHFDKGSEGLAALRGARLVTASETDEGRRWDEARLKAVTGADTIRARRLYENSTEYKPTWKLTFLGNHTPAIQNLDDALRRRIVMVAFTRKPSAPDPQLEEKLQVEWPAILQWMIEGAVAWHRDGLTRPKAVVEATAEYFAEQDTFGSWLAERCQVELGSVTLKEKAISLYEDWRAFASQQGEDPGSIKTFGAAMRKRGFQKKQDRAWGTKAFFGVRLKQR
ncbi:phage/plasmid primase, P4 family [Mesorhizobium sp. KR2-14]|uniref:phage/plasmid primase, P4 family n=1 Tax=Mesorhizobium sp. KR2-14 TaxID=3156610 RepID=UPI0032B44CC2